MCSLSWRRNGNRVSLFFTRDESVLRSKAHLPQLFDDGGVQFLMPKDPDGKGSWLAANEFGLVIVLLNDYQGRMKSQSQSLKSRGLLVRKLASCRSISEASVVLKSWSLAMSQPFQLGLLQANCEQLWHYDGVSSQIQTGSLPPHLFSSGHPEADAIIAARQNLIRQMKLNTDNELLALHKSHLPEVKTSLGKPDLAYSICMHRAEAKSQSLTQVNLVEDKVVMRYWDGQPCETDQYFQYELAIADAAQRVLNI